MLLRANHRRLMPPLCRAPRRRSALPWSSLHNYLHVLACVRAPLASCTSCRRRSTAAGTRFMRARGRGGMRVRLCGAAVCGAARAGPGRRGLAP